MNTMNKPKGPSAEEIKARKAQEEALARKESTAAEQAAKEKEKRERVTAAYKRGSYGRRSLIGTSELGIKAKLGG